MNPQYRSDAHGRIAWGVLLLAFLYSCLSIVRPVRQVTATFNDDAAYYLNIARNFVAGFGWTFDRIHLTNGYEPLWQYVLVALCRLVPGTPDTQIHWVIVIQTILLSLTALVMWRLLARKFGGRGAATSVVFFVALLFFPMRNGMETSLFALLVLALLESVSSGNPLDSQSAMPAARLGVLIGSLVLTRLDTVFYVFALLALLLFDWKGSAGAWPRRLGRLALVGILASVMVVPYLAYNLATFGHLMPISGAVKSSFPHAGLWYRGFALSAQERLLFFLSVILAAVQLVWRWGPGRNRADSFWRNAITPLSIGVLVHQIWSILFMKWGVFGWHFAMGRLLVCLLLAPIAEEVLTRLPGRAAASAWAVACALLLLIGAFGIYRRDWGDISRDSWRQDSYDTAKWVNSHLPPDAVLAMKDCGYMGLISNRSVVNLDGMVNNFEFQERMRRGEFRQYLRDAGVGYAIIQGSIAPDATYEFGSYSHLYDVGGGQVTLTPADEVYRSSPAGGLIIRRVPG